MKKILSAVLACAATMSLATCAFADVEVGETPAPTTPAPVTNEIKVEGKLEGADLAKAVLKAADDKGDYKWADVESITLKADKAFKVTLKVAAGKVEGKADATTFVVDVDKLVKADAEGFATSHVIGADLIAATTEDGMAVEAKDGATITLTAEVTVKKGSTPTEPDPEQKPTGVALAIAPAGLAVAFVTVAAVMNKKKRG